MYPVVNDRQSTIPADRHPGSIPPVSGVPNPSSTAESYAASRPYASYFSTSMRPSAPMLTGNWTTGLCHCCDDPANCVITCFCPCITFGQIAEIVNQGSTSCAASGVVYGLLLAFSGFACLYSCFYRSLLRGQYDLEESPCVDCLVHCCCETCALCQEYRELKNRGFDMGIGWEANMDRQKRGVTVAPVMASGMTR